jgi:hypothetical protein
MAAGTAFACGTDRAAQPTGLGHSICQGAIAKIARNLRYVAGYELVALAMALKVSAMRLLGRTPPVRCIAARPWA